VNPPELFWTKVAAIGQAAGAIATFVAVWISLYLARSERRFQLRVTARLAHLIDENSQTPVVAIDVENVGHRSVKVLMFGWSGGFFRKWWRWRPAWLKSATAFQQPDYNWLINPAFPWNLEPGDAKSTLMRRDEFFAECDGKFSEIFFRKIPFTNRHIAVCPRVFVTISSYPQALFGRIDDNLLHELRMRHQAYVAANP